MAIWQDDKSGDRHDDGQALLPGEAGFTRELAEKHFGHKNFSYVGTPNWAPPAQLENTPAPAGDEPQGESQ